MNSPILILANLLILMMVFLVVPVWIIVRLKQPSWTKLLLGFNYFALLIILFVQISAMGSLFHANQVAKKNCEALIPRAAERTGGEGGCRAGRVSRARRRQLFPARGEFPEQEGARGLPGGRSGDCRGRSSVRCGEVVRFRSCRSGFTRR